MTPKTRGPPSDQKGSEIRPTPHAIESAGHLAVVVRKHRRSGEWQRSRAISIDNGVNLLRRRRIRHRNHVIAQQHHAHGAALAGQVVDGPVGILLAALAVRFQPRLHALVVKVPGEDLRIRHRPVRPPRVLHMVQGDRRLAQVPLKDEAGRIDETLVSGIMLHRMLIEAHGGAQWLEVDVQDAVGLRQQSSYLRRRLLPQPGKHPQQHDDDGGNEKRSAGASAHEGRKACKQDSSLRQPGSGRAFLKR